MRIYSELILGKTDPGLRAPEKKYDLSKAREHAAIIENLGFDGLVATETKGDPYILMALAASATVRLELATSVAIAFPRAPAITAMAAWDLQKLSGGRFILGLGTQIRAHLIRRFGMEDHAIGPWMRDYVRAVQAIWRSWQTGKQLNFQSDRYKLDLMVPLFDPGPLDTRHRRFMWRRLTSICAASLEKWAMVCVPTLCVHRVIFRKLCCLRQPKVQSRPDVRSMLWH